MSRLGLAADQFAQRVEQAWNLRDVDAIVLCNAIDCLWRNRIRFLWGREQVRAFVEQTVRRDHDLRVIYEPWAQSQDRLSLRFAAEFHNDSGVWFRAYGSEEMEFDHAGLVMRRLTTANDHPILEHERVMRWPSGARPLDHPTLSELGF